MPVTFFLLQHWNKQQTVFLQNLALLRRQPQQSTAIHDLRVAVKKLRAYLALFHLLVNDIDGRQAFEKTEQLFTVLGKQRDIGTALSLLNEFEKSNKTRYTALRSQWRPALQRAGAWAKDALGKYDEKETGDLTLHLQQRLEDADIDKLARKAKSIAGKEMKNLQRDAKHFSDRPHTMRKALKHIFYWITIFPKDLQPDAEQLKKLKKALDDLGDWQDLEMLREKVKHFRKDFVPDTRDEYAGLKELETIIDGKMDTRLKKAEDHFNGFSQA